jgi:hypothetical protein
MKKQKIYALLACLLAVFSVFIIINKSGGFNKSRKVKALSTIFAVEDTASVTRIFMADMFQNKVLLSKTEAGWVVDYDKPASAMRVTDLLATLNALRVAQPVAKEAHHSTIQMLATSATKVEIYATKPLFSLFGYPFFSKERLEKVFFLGDATQNNMGSFASLEGMEEPYVVYMPGFRGYVTPQFSPKPTDWYSHLIFDTKLTRIQKASFVDLENSDNSFFVEKSGARTFSLFDVHDNILRDYDTTLLINMLSEFKQRNYEQYLTKIAQSLKDSIIQFNLFKTISVTDVDNKTTTMKLYHQINTGSLYEDGDLVAEIYNEFSKDRCYATMNENTKDIYTIQFFHFDRQLQPLSYYLKR